MTRQRIALIAILQFIVATPLAYAQRDEQPLDFSLAPQAPQAAQPHEQTLDKIVAVVNDGVILQSELDAAVEQVRSQIGGRADRIAPDVLRSQVLDRMIMKRLQVQRAEDNGIKVSVQDMQQGLGRIAQRNGMTLDQLKQAVTNSGMSLDELRDQIRQQILISKLRQQEVMSKVVVSDDDVNRYLQNQSVRIKADRQYRLAQIVVPVAEDATPGVMQAARSRAQTLRRRVVDGGRPFAAVAQAASRGLNAGNGGDLGWMQGANLPNIYGAVLPDMNTGDVSRVFRGPDGFHILKLEGERGGSAPRRPDKVMVHEVKARHILLKPNEIRDAQRTEEMARQVRERINAGASFAALARQYSDDKSTSNQGGELGWLPIDRLGSTTRRQLDDVGDQGITPIFETGNGYEIIQVEGRRERDETDQARRNEARKTLGEQRSQDEGQLWLRRIRDEAYVDIRMANYKPSQTP